MQMAINKEKDEYFGMKLSPLSPCSSSTEDPDDSVDFESSCDTDMGNLECPVTSCPLWKRGGVKTPATEQARIHRFPAYSLDIREAWEAFVGRANGMPFKSSKNHGLCSAHFASRYVMPTGRVTRDAIPTIAPLATKKVLCKWDMPPEPIFVTPLSETLKKRENTPRSAKAEHEYQMQQIYQTVHPSVDFETSDLDEFSSDEIQEVKNSISATDKQFEINNTIVCKKLEEKDNFPTIKESDNLLTAEDLNILNVGRIYSIPDKPKSLNTVHDVEIAIEREKKLALQRYKDSLRKIRGLEMILKRVKRTQSQDTNDTSIQQPGPSTCTSSSLDESTPFQEEFPFERPPIQEDHDLPLPLFDDLN